MELFRSVSDDPAFHLAQEHSFLTARPAKEVLFFYINRPSVIVGRNQCMEAEVDVSYCERHSIPVVKRLSGGGTVYHDYGNINYAFVCGAPAQGSCLDIDFSLPVLAALASLGIHATVGCRKELLLEGRKFSGTASHVSNGRILFHGTLLHRSNLVVLNRVLQGQPALRGKKVASVSSRVVNLGEITGSSESTVEFLDRLICFFQCFYGVERVDWIEP